MADPLLALQRVARRAGLDVRRWSPANSGPARRAAIMRTHGITLVLDVGANAGQYGEELRREGYRGRIVSFEPLSAPFAALAARAARDPGWTAHQLAAGHERGRVEMHVAGNSYSSSLLAITERHVRSAPESRTVGRERVEVERLDAVGPRERRDDDRVLLKVDVQGYELRVLEGAGHFLDQVDVVETELSLAPLYEGQPLLAQVMARLEGEGFEPVALEPEFTDATTGHVLQVDGIFARREAP